MAKLIVSLHHGDVNSQQCFIGKLGLRLIMLIRLCEAGFSVTCSDKLMK